MNVILYPVFYFANNYFRFNILFFNFAYEYTCSSLKISFFCPPKVIFSALCALCILHAPSSYLLLLFNSCLHASSLALFGLGKSETFCFWLSAKLLLLIIFLHVVTSQFALFILIDNSGAPPYS